MRKYFNSGGGYGKVYSLEDIIEPASDGIEIQTAKILKSGCVAELALTVHATGTDVLMKNVYKQIGTLKSGFRPANLSIMVGFIGPTLIGFIVNTAGVVQCKALTENITATGSINATFNYLLAL